MQRRRGFLPLVAVLTAGTLAAAERWVQDTFEDFSAGRLEDGGANLYVTRAGSVEAVHRFDLNRDGFVDLVFNSSHDERRAIRPTCIAVAAGQRTARELPLQAYGTSAAVIADLNNDGRPEAVLLPNNNGTTTRRLLAVFWADEKGWSAERRTNLWTMDARALAVGDLNHDGWPDIAVLNGSRWAPEDGPEAVVRIYWGSRDGFRHEDRRDVVLAGAVDLQIADLDGDGRADLAVLLNNPGSVLVYWDPASPKAAPAKLDLGTTAVGRLLVADWNGDRQPDLVASGGVRELVSRDPTTGLEEYRYSGAVLVAGGPGKRTWGAPRLLAAPRASALAMADLDRDGHADLLLADREAPEDSVTILWGDAAQAFNQRPRTGLPIGYGAALAVEDVDADGMPDVAVGVAREAMTYQGQSRVYFGDKAGGFTPGLAVDTAGVGGIATARDAQGTRLIFCNIIAGRVYEDVPATVYWGDGRNFDPARTARFGIRSGYASAAADLNHDGYPDLVLLSIVHAKQERHPGMGFNILWGGPDGLKDDRRTVLYEYGVWGVSLADVDRDGWLDIVGNCNKPSPEGEPPRVVIWPGGSQGFLRERRVVLRADGAEGQNVVADFNQDGWPDIAVAQERAHGITIFPGSEKGFSEQRKSFLPLVAANDLKAADLNQDGWLDLVVTSHRMPDTSFFDFGTYIFWGGAAGFKPTNARQLPGQDGIGVTIADWDGDGWLDVLLPGYHYGHTREAVAAHLFWGGADGFDDQRQTEFMQDGGHGAMAADFNGDGRLDLAIACHTRNGTHDSNSLVFFNDGARFATVAPLKLPTVGPHFMERADVGDIRDRAWRHAYESPAFTLGQASSGGSIRVTAPSPGKSRLEIAVRAAADQAGLAQRPWQPLDGDRFGLRPGDRAFQYRVEFISDNGDRYPALDRVEVEFSGSDAPGSAPRK